MTATPTLQPILLDGRWQPASEPIDQFRAINPATAAVIEDRSYPVSGWSDLAALLQAGRRAAATMATLSSERIADFLDTYATCLEQRAGALVEAAHIETGLPRKPRLAQVELPRTTGQLRQAAAAVREGSWRRATIDSAANIRSWLAPLGGPVVVIGPNNFPFAFNGVAGGDMAAAIAAGNPVIAKAHPGHPHTSMLLAEAALEAIQATQMPPATVQMFFHTSPELGLRLVSDPDTAAVAFTGSRAAGLALKAAADQAGRPIYLELSSLNPIFVLAGAVRGAEPEFLTLVRYGELQYSNCLWGLVPASISDEESPFNECSHAYLAAAKEVLLRMRAMPAMGPRAGEIASRISYEAALEGAAFIGCVYSGEGFNTADIVRPQWHDVPFHLPTVLSLAGAFGFLPLTAFAASRIFPAKSRTLAPTG